MFCTTECWSCEDKTCEHYIDKTKLYFENEKNKEEIERLNNTLKSLYTSLEIIDSIRDESVVKMQIRNLLYNYRELKGSDKDE